jgi:hypothetical protein
VYPARWHLWKQISTTGRLREKTYTSCSFILTGEDPDPRQRLA